jgi:hypothetical protein
VNPMWLVSGPTIVACAGYLLRLAVTYPRRTTPAPIPAGPIVVGYTQDALQARIHRNSDLEDVAR